MPIPDSLPPLPPLPPLPLTPDPLTPAQQRAERARQWAFIHSEQRAGHIPMPPAATPVPTAALPRARHPAAARPPARRRFAVHELRRIPVAVSPAAQALINASSEQGRLLPQALAEVLGQHAGIARVRVDVSADGMGAPGERTLLEIIAESVVAHIPPHRWLVNAADLTGIHPGTRLVLFNAAEMARELLRLYPHRW